MSEVKRITTITAALIAALSMAFAGDASAKGGAELQRLCSRSRVATPTLDDLGDIAECYGYIHGAADSVRMRIGSFCLPERGITNGIITQVVLAYLDKHPERLHLTAACLVEEGLTAAYPCSPK
jgi:hypothetical protein